MKTQKTWAEQIAEWATKKANIKIPAGIPTLQIIRILESRQQSNNQEAWDQSARKPGVLQSISEGA